MGRRAKPAKVKAKRPLARKAPKRETAGTRELEKRLAEALEQQTATAEILKVISSSPTDIQPVLDAVAERAARLCDATDAVIRRVDGDRLRMAAHFGPVPVTVDAHKITRGSVGGRTVLECRTVHVHDIVARESEKEYPDAPALQSKAGYRTMLAVPLVREGAAAGIILIRRLEVRPFTDRQIQLLETFADQAVIAIANVRLFNETKEALEQQTATADILRIISGSLTDTQPVFDAIVKNCRNLFEGGRIVLWLLSEDRLHLQARAIAGAADLQVLGDKLPIDRASAIGVCVLDGRMIHLPDLEQAAGQYPRIRQLGLKWGYHSGIYAPLLREGRAVGGLSVLRREAGAFDDKEVALLKTFADQAVIAIENVRLFNETKEALEQQTATAGILRVISGSPTDIQPVFDAIAESAARLCGADDVVIRQVEGNSIRLVAHIGPVTLDRSFDVRPLSVRTISGSAIREGRTLHVHDISEPRAREQYPESAVVSREGGWYRTVLVAPLLREGTAIGTILIRRKEVGPFSDKQVKLLETFADQAVIAIENVRLFTELQARNAEVTAALEQQTATAEVLKVISRSTFDLETVLQTLMDNAAILCRAKRGVMFRRDGDVYRLVATYNVTPELREYLQSHSVAPDRATISGRSIMEKRPVHVHDVLADSEYQWGDAARLGNYRTVLGVPLLREGEPMGMIGLTRDAVEPFSEQEIALVTTFADQATIAIENVRLFNETKEALEQQTATADILRVISSSPTDLQPVFDTILEKAIRLCDAHMGHLGLYDGEKYQYVAQRGYSAEFAKYVIERGPFRPQSIGGLVRMIAERQPIQVADAKASSGYRDGVPGVIKLVELGGARTFILVPMLKEGRVVGGITIYRPVVQPFTQKQIDLVSTFANQAVIAIENVRLFNEINEALQRQTSIAEILRVISSSPTDVMPVLEAVTRRAAQLCDAPDARLFILDGDSFRYVAGFGDLMGAIQSLPLTRGSVVGRAIMDQSVVHIEDLAAALDDFPDVRGAQQTYGNRTTLAVPLVRENKAFGGIVMRRTEVRPFTEKQIELVKTFADQAVIAIENVRLFNEIQDKSRQLEVASRHKSQFLANMSHELRTPLNAVLGYTELILDGIYGEVSEKVRDVMGRVDKSGRHLLGLINDVLDLSKIEAGQLTLALNDYSLTDVVQTVLTGVESLAAEKKLALKSALASDLPRGRGDDRRLAQVFLNLVGNAIKFTEAGEVRLEARCSNGEFVVAVADTGPGISAADQQRIFEEFQQVDDSATRKKGGTGLGLSIARRIVELHGGRIGVESAPGRGATFTVTLPVRVERQAVPA